MERNTDAGDPNLTSFSTSSTSSSSLSPSNPFKQIHAALKRHRPLGTMQSDLPRARRVLVQPKNTVSKPSTSLKPQTKLVSKPSQNRKTGTVLAGTSKKESSLTPPAITETLNNDNTRDREIELENHEKKVGDEMLVDLKQPDVDFNYANVPVIENNNNNNDNFGDDYMVGDAPQDSKMENKVSSHMDSLALDSNKKFQNLDTKFEGSNIPQNIPQLKQLNPINADPITQLNPINPITQSSCITKQCMPNYENAPAEKNYENAPVEKKDLIPPPNNKKDKKEKEKEKMKKRGHDTELFFKVNGKYYQKLEKIGSGGSSEVHKVISAEKKIYALKKIKLKGRDYPTALGFCQEIEYLNTLKGKKYIIQLIDYEITDPGLVLEGSGKNKIKEGRIKEDHYIYMVLEYGEKDLSNMLYQFWEEMDFDDNIQIDEDLLRSYWKQMLRAVNTIHEERIVHSDLKPANFLLVGGTLKLIDFGIAKAINNDTTNIQRDAQVGTLSYMSPEAFLCSDEDADGARIKCGRPSDIWSLGCILYQMVYGKTPFSQYTSFWAKFKAVTDRNHEILYLPVDNPLLIDLMKRCLAWDRNDRWTISMLLKHPFFMKMDGPGRNVIHRICMLANHPESSRMWAHIDEVLTRYEQ